MGLDLRLLSLETRERLQCEYVMLAKVSVCTSARQVDSKSGLSKAIKATHLSHSSG